MILFYSLLICSSFLPILAEVYRLEEVLPKYHPREIRRRQPNILQLIGPLAFGRKDGDDTKYKVPMIGELGYGDVNQITAKFTPEGTEQQKPNGGTFPLNEDGAQLGYMNHETTMGERAGSKGKLSIGGVGNFEVNDINEQGTGVLDFSNALFPFLQLPSTKNESVKEEFTQVDPTYTEYFYPKPRSYLNPNDDSYKMILNEPNAKVQKNPFNRDSEKLPKDVPSSPFAAIKIRPKYYSVKTETGNEKEGFIAQSGKQIDPDELKEQPKVVPSPINEALLSASKKVALVSERKSIHDIGLSDNEIYALCAKFSAVANKHCYKNKVEDQYLERCRGYQTDCSQYIAKSKPLGAVANAFNSGVGLTFYDWSVNGIPYFPVNEEGGVGNGHHGKVDFGSWGGGYSDNVGVRDFWSQTQEYGANWYEGMYGYKTGWSIPIVQGVGIEGGQGAQVSVPLKEGDLGKPISVTNGYHVGPYIGLADRFGIDWLNGGVSWNKGFAVPFVGIGVNSGTSVGFPSVGHIMNRMGLNGVETLNMMARAAADETAKTIQSSAQSSH